MNVNFRSAVVGPRLVLYFTLLLKKYSFPFAEAFFFSVSYPFMQNLPGFLLQNLTERLIFFLFPFFSQSFSQPSWKDNSEIKVGVAVLLYDIV